MAPIRKAAFMSIRNIAEAGGFSNDYILPKNRRLAALVVGNSVSPPVAAACAESLVMTGIFKHVATKWKVAEALPTNVVEATLLLQKQISTVALDEKEWPLDSWRKAANTYRQSCLKARKCRGIRRRKSAQAPVITHPLALVPPREAQSPLLWDFRASCKERKIAVATAAGEMAAGLGRRFAKANVSGRRSLLTPGSKHDALEAALERIELLRRGDRADGSRCGLWQPITGWPSLCWKRWKASGASPKLIRWLRGGYPFDIIDVIPPIGLEGGAVSNHPGCEEHATWLHETFAEFLQLGIVHESPHIPACVMPLNVIPKGDFDANDPVLKNRLRLLVDQRKANPYIHAPRFRCETLHRARGLIEENMVALQYDCSSFFYHWPTAPQHQEYIGCTLGQGGPLGGRYFTWACTPMGTCSSPWVSAAMAFCLSKRWRALGLKFIWYVDDIIIFCKREEAKQIARFVEQELEDHGLLRNPSKSYSEPRERITGLGIDVWLDKMIFRVPKMKRDGIVEECQKLVDETAAGEEVQLWRLASA